MKKLKVILGVAILAASFGSTTFGALMTAAAPKNSVAVSLPPNVTANYEGLKAFYDAAHGAPQMAEFDTYPSANPHPLHCLSFATSQEYFFTYPLVVTSNINGKTDTKFMAVAMPRAIPIISKSQKQWDGITNFQTPQGLTEKVIIDGETAEVNFRKNGGVITYEANSGSIESNGTAGPQNTTYGYCYRLDQEKWLGFSLSSTNESKKFFSGWSYNQPDKAAAESVALQNCGQRVGSASQCVTKSVQNGCSVVVFDKVSGRTYWAMHSGTNEASAQAYDEAMAACHRNDEEQCREFVEVCSDGSDFEPGAISH